MAFDINSFKWTRKSADYFVSNEKIEIVTTPNTLTSNQCGTDSAAERMIIASNALMTA